MRIWWNLRAALAGHSPPAKAALLALPSWGKEMVKEEQEALPKSSTGRKIAKL